MLKLLSLFGLSFVFACGSASDLVSNPVIDVAPPTEDTTQPDDTTPPTEENTNPPNDDSGEEEVTVDCGDFLLVVRGEKVGVLGDPEKVAKLCEDQAKKIAKDEDKSSEDEDQPKDKKDKKNEK